ncbi:glycosyltransferase [Bacillus smithii]|uniref:glycosyltransferase n=1 Tax=Bacillus smithii TaxID=1479 RepID=UPI002E237216|nr:glycosyltransferase [Bacillus smithii]
MKICFLAGASSIHTVRWINAMVERGHDVHLITMHKPDKDKIDEKANVYFLPFKPPKGYYLNVFKIKNLLKRIKPDILNTHYASGYGTLSRLLNYYPTLLSVWGSDVYDFPYENKLKKKILIKNLKAATRIASTSFAMKEQTERFVNPSMPIVVTPFGVDIHKFCPQKELKDPNVITIGIVKKLEEKYGVRYLIEAVYLLKRKLEENNQHEFASKLRLLIVGQGSQFRELMALTKKLKIDNITTFTGSVPHDEVPNYLNKLDIYCAPSTLDSESFGVAIIEASACEVPVVVSDVGGLPEVVKNGETGYVVQRKNANQIAEKLHMLVIDSEKRKEFGKNGRNYVRSIYNWEENVERMEKVYEDLIKMK